jgi:transposase
LPDFGRMTGRQAAARARGRAEVRAVLYMTVLSAARYNPVLRTFKERLARAGKKAKVILTAMARKLVVLANAVLRSGRRFDPTDQAVAA